VNKIPTVVVYKKRDRDLLPLQAACEILKMALRVVESEEEFQKQCNQEAISCIIVPLGSHEQGGDNAREFANVAAKILQPEDADVSIVYSTEGYTPANWPGTLDPRPIYSDDDPEFLPDDRQWKNTIAKLGQLKKRFRHPRSPAGSTVKTEVESPSKVSFTSEADFLLRAAFKDMSKITIGFPEQGLSGSFAYIIQPFDSFGHECKQVFVKIYADQEKAQKELSNLFTYFEPYIRPALSCIPTFQTVPRQSIFSNCDGARGRAQW